MTIFIETAISSGYRIEVENKGALIPARITNTFKTVKNVSSACLTYVQRPVAAWIVSFCSLFRVNERHPFLKARTFEPMRDGLGNLCSRSDSTSLNFMDEDGNTSLFYAIKYNNCELVDNLMARGINVNHQNRHHQNALFLAIFPVCRIYIMLGLIVEGAIVSTKHFNILLLTACRIEKTETSILILNFVVLAGYNIFTDKRICLGEEKEQMKVWIYERRRRCLTLKQLSRLCIRKQTADRSTKVCLSALILKLGLPPSLNDYLTFKKRRSQILAQSKNHSPSICESELKC